MATVTTLPVVTSTDTGDRFVLEYDYREDGGPRLIGPFSTRGQADAYARNLNLREAAYCVCPITTP